MTEVNHEAVSPWEVESNLRAFIARSRNTLAQSETGGLHNANAWRFTQLSNAGFDTISRRHLVFCTLESLGTGEPRAMARPFRDFAKAYLLLKYAGRPAGAVAGMATLRLIDAALRDIHKTSNPVFIDDQVLGRACEIAKERYGFSTIRRFARHLWSLQQFVLVHSMVVTGMRVKSPSCTGLEVSGNRLSAHAAQSRGIRWFGRLEVALHEPGPGRLQTEGMSRPALSCRKRVPRHR